MNSGMRRFIRLSLVLLGLCVGGLRSAWCADAVPAAPADRATTRIVSLVPSLTEMVFALGAADQLAGVSDYCRYPEAARSKPQVGGLLNPNVEKILLLKPTVVLAYQSQSEVAAKLTSLGVEIRLLSTDRLEDVFRNLELLGELTGRQAEARTAARELKESLDSVRRRAASLPHPRTLLVVSRDPAELRNLYVSTPSHYLGELLEIAGGTNVVEAGRPAAISKEQILRADPEVLLDFSLAESAGEQGIRRALESSWKQLSTVQAVKRGRVHLIGNPSMLVPGLSAGKTALMMFDLLHPAGEK